MLAARLARTGRSLFLLFLSIPPLLSFFPDVPTSAPIAEDKSRPNILWIFTEDLSPYFGCYGDEINKAHTPTVDKLAREGVLFRHAYMPAPVCSACRSALITGVYQTTLGVHQHRSSRAPKGVVPKSARIELPAGWKTIPERMRDAGYFTFNSGKDDYNFHYDRRKLYSVGTKPGYVAGENGWQGNFARHSGSFTKDTWSARPDKSQPWFGQIMLWGGKARARHARKGQKLAPQALTPPPYFPDTPAHRKAWTTHYNAARGTDHQVEQILAQLKADGELENTIVLFFSDHGNNQSLRHKQFCYEGGVHVPLIVWGKHERLGAGVERKDLVSGLDIPATTLAFAGVELPKGLDGHDLFARDFEPRTHVISARDRCDYSIDRIRTVRSDRFRYIRNGFVDRPMLQAQYRDKQATVRDLKRLRAAGKLSAYQARFWFGERPREELYGIAADPHEMRNLATDPSFAKELQQHRATLDAWIKATGDKGQAAEAPELLRPTFELWKKRPIFQNAEVNPEYEQFRKQDAGDDNAEKSNKKRPNIVILYADDMGYGDLGVQNARSKIPTPNLDALARSGMRFVDGHSSSGICTPSRYALLTGRYHWRDFHGIVGAMGKSVFKMEQLTMPEMLRARGYATACIGKWHLGWDWNALRKKGAEPRELGKRRRRRRVYGPEAYDWSKAIPDGPLAHGFDHYFGDTVINFPPYCWIEDDRVVKAPDVMMDTKRWKKIKEGGWECRPGPAASDWNPYDNIPTLTKRAVEWLEAQKGSERPFFLYVPFPSPHAPIIPNDTFDGKSGAGPYGDFVCETDDACGQILRALERIGQKDNTIVVFSADNGPEQYAYARDAKFAHWSAEPLRGLKRDIHEGGHRVPFVVRWPGVTKAGAVSKAMISQIDLYATFAAACGFDIPKAQAIDSIDQGPVLRGEKKALRKKLIHNTRKGMYAIRKGRWLLVDAKQGYISRRNAAWEKRHAYSPDDKSPVELYDLELDLGQRKNLAQSEPKVVTRLREVFAAERAKTTR